MALQIRRGLESQRAGVTPDAGELLYTTDEKLVYVGDGATVGGNLLAGGGGIADIVSDTSPQLGGNLDVNSQSIVSTSNGNIVLDPNGTGTIALNADITTTGNITKTGELNISPTLLTSFGNNTTLVDGNVFISRNTYSTTFGAGFTFAQHHATADAVNFGFYRTRGTGLVPTAVLNGDDLADISFFAWDGTARAGGASISATVEGVPSTGHIPTKFSFATDNGSVQAVRAELSAAGIWKVNSIQNYSGTSLTLTATDIIIAGNAKLNAQGDLRFADADSSNWVAFQAPTTVGTNVTWTLPDADGTSGQMLSTNGSGTLSWATAAGAGGLTSRGTVTGSTASIANGATGNISITGYKGYILYKINVTGAAWVRIYTDTASRTADSSRLEGSDPAPGAGVIAEVITTGGQTILMSPGVFGFNNESSPTTDIPVAVTNKSGAPATFTVTLTIVQLEV